MISTFTPAGSRSTAIEGFSSQSAQSCDSPIPETISSTGTTTTAERAMNIQA